MCDELDSESNDELYRSPVSSDTLQERWEKMQKLDTELTDQQRLQLLIQNEIILTEL